MSDKRALEMADRANAPNEPPSASRRDTRVRATILIVGSLVLLAMAYGSGMGQRNREIRAVRQALWTDRYQLQLAREENRSQRRLLHALEARRQLDLARTSINVGDIAAARLAVQRAKEILAASGVADPARLGALPEAQANSDAATLRPRIEEGMRWLDGDINRSLAAKPLTDSAKPLAGDDAP